MVRESPTPKPTSTLRIADAQAYLLWPILLQIIVFLAFFLFDGIGLGCKGDVLAVSAFLILTAVKTYGLLKALDNKLTLFWALVASLPLVGLFVLIPANIAAAHKLRAAGLKVGFLGVPKSDRNALRDALARESGR
jgi:hypothetical protein